MEPLTVSEVVLKNTPQFNPNGTVTQSTILSYRVGPHGPFTFTWNDPPGSPTPDAVLTLIQQKVADLQKIAAGVASFNLTIAA